MAGPSSGASAPLICCCQRCPPLLPPYFGCNIRHLPLISPIHNSSGYWSRYWYSRTIKELGRDCSVKCGRCGKPPPHDLLSSAAAPAGAALLCIARQTKNAAPYLGVQFASPIGHGLQIALCWAVDHLQSANKGQARGDASYTSMEQQRLCAFSSLPAVRGLTGRPAITHARPWLRLPCRSGQSENRGMGSQRSSPGYSTAAMAAKRGVACSAQHTLSGAAASSIEYAACCPPSPQHPPPISSSGANQQLLPLCTCSTAGTLLPLTWTMQPRWGQTAL